MRPLARNRSDDKTAGAGRQTAKSAKVMKLGRHYTTDCHTDEVLQATVRLVAEECALTVVRKPMHLSRTDPTSEAQLTTPCDPPECRAATYIVSSATTHRSRIARGRARGRLKWPWGSGGMSCADFLRYNAHPVMKNVNRACERRRCLEFQVFVPAINTHPFAPGRRVVRGKLPHY